MNRERAWNIITLGGYIRQYPNKYETPLAY